jgi:predicted PurR-regulated permease PerM
MDPDNTTIRRFLSTDLLDFVIRVGIIAFLLVMSARIFAPFAGLLTWALILAVALYPLHQLIAKKYLGGRQGRTATLMVLVGLLGIVGPTAMVGSSFAGHIHDAYTALENDTLTIKQPDAKVADWPVIGTKVHSIWSDAATNIPAFLKKNQDQIKKLSKHVLSGAANTLSTVFLFIGALIIAGIMMAYGDSGSQVIRRIFSRMTGPDKGPYLQTLSTATIRSVAVGVIGIAFIQALLLGIGFIMADIPAAGVLAIVVLLLGIVQLPAVLISVPAIIYLWVSGDASTTSNIFFTIYLLIAGMADNVLKPLLLGRGVDVPMPVILIGALGGMITSGIVGLFVGAVLLAVTYRLFMDWVDHPDAIVAENAQSASDVEPVIATDS